MPEKLFITVSNELFLPRYFPSLQIVIKRGNGLSLTPVIRTHKLLSLLQDMEVTANELRKVLNRFMSKREYI